MIRFPSACRASVSHIRCLSFKATINLDDPSAAIKHVREELDALRSSGNSGTTKHMHALINLAICHFHLGEYFEARDVALLAHSRVTESRGASSSLVYFSATTAAKCSQALATSFRLHAEEQNRMAATSDALAPSAAKTLRSDAMLKKLDNEVQNFQQLANNCINDPRNFFMRSGKGFRDDCTSSSASASGNRQTSSKTSERVHFRRSLMQRSVSKVPK